MRKNDKKTDLTFILSMIFLMCLMLNISSLIIFLSGCACDFLYFPIISLGFTMFVALLLVVAALIKLCQTSIMNDEPSK